MLDPRISYEGLKIDYGDDMILSDHLEDSKTNLFKYFDKHYAMHTPTPSTPPSTPVQASVSAAPAKARLEPAPESAKMIAEPRRMSPSCRF